jgi:hypothetical protein
LEREAEIDRLDKLWRAAIDAEDPFLEEFLHNPTADLLREQQNIVDDLFGEIFLTNRYGAVIAATGQLTNFAQGDEYWWQAAVHGGEGRVFFDDRGYDVSVGDFVLGVTAPVYHDGEVVGVLKNNLRILDLFGEIIEHYSPLYEPGSVQIARSGGLVIWEPEQASLSTQVPREVVSLLGTETTAAILADGDGRGSLFAVSPIVSTTALSEQAFGGNEEAADQRLGNKGENWVVVLRTPGEVIDAMVQAQRRQFLITGFISIFVLSGLTLLFVSRSAKPISRLVELT